MGRSGFGWLASAASLAMVAGPLIGATAAQAQNDGQVQFDVPAGELDYVLTSIATQARRRIVFDPTLTRGRTAPRVTGRMRPEVAIRAALAGTDLIVRLSDQGDWLVLRAPTVSQAGAKLLDTVRVEASTDAGASADGRYVGANGSSDPIATEGTKSYTARATTLASKTPLALQDTPQAISVLTRQQVDDRAITSFNGGLDALPGLSLTRQADGSTSITSRGFAINNVQIDGGAPIAVGTTRNFASNYRVTDDLSIYDSVTVQRGSAGSFNGSGGAGGVINLERKRPLDHSAAEITLQGGSWNQLRGVVDISSPAIANGLIRARAVLTADRSDYFYNDASRRFAQGYLNVEIDASPKTIINIGGKINNLRDTPFRGLPTGPDGQLLDLPRDTCLCTSWSRARTDSREVFAQLRQTIGDHVVARLNGTGTWQKGSDDFLVFSPIFGTIGTTPGLANDGNFNVFRNDRRSDQFLVDGFVSGNWKVAGIAIEATVGANFQRVNQRMPTPGRTFQYSDFTVIPFDSSRFPRPADSELSLDGSIFTPEWSQKRIGAYATLRISPRAWLDVTISERFDRLIQNTVNAFSETDLSPNIVRRSNWSPPNVGVVGKLSKQISLYANYSSIYDPQNLLTLRGTLLPPLSGINVEAGFKAALRDGKVNAALAGFYINTRNLSSFDPATDPFENPSNPSTGAACCYLLNGATQRSRGVEAQLQGALTDRLNLDLSYTYTNVTQKDAPGDSSIPLQRMTPEHLVKLWASWRVPSLADKLTLGLGGHVESAVESNAVRNNFDPATFTFSQSVYRTPRPGYATVDALVRYAFDDRFSLQLNVTNLLDRKYYQTVQTSIGAFYGAPRAFQLTLRKGF